MARLPNQFVPLLVVKNVYTSDLLAVVVLVGTVPPGHFTEAGHTIVLPAVASFVSNRVNEIAPEVTPVVKVNVVFAARVAVTKLPLARLIVVAAAVLPTALIASA
jgi:hypothetical protein